MSKYDTMTDEQIDNLISEAYGRGYDTGLRANIFLKGDEAYRRGWEAGRDDAAKQIAAEVREQLQESKDVPHPK